MIISQNREELALATTISRQCELTSIKLLESHSRLHEHEGLVEPFRIVVRESICVAWRFQDGHVIYDAKFRVESVDASVPERTMFEIESVYRIEYEMRGGDAPTDEQMAAFGRGNVLLNLWPYFRELTHGLAVKMDHLPPPLPLMRIFPALEPEVKPPGVVQIP